MVTDFDQFINRMLGGLNNVSPTPVAPPATPSAPVYQSPVQAPRPSAPMSAGLDLNRLIAQAQALQQQRSQVASAAPVQTQPVPLRQEPAPVQAPQTTRAGPGPERVRSRYHAAAGRRSFFIHMNRGYSRRLTFKCRSAHPSQWELSGNATNGYTPRLNPLTTPQF